jgi:hypothetical protein
MRLANLSNIRTPPVMQENLTRTDDLVNSPACSMSGFFENGTTFVTSRVVDGGFYTSTSHTVNISYLLSPWAY